MEKSVFTNRIMDIKKDTERIYYGNEFCEKLIPSIETLEKFYRLVKAKNKHFTFVTPFVTNSGLEKVSRLLDFLNKQPDVEVVFNDWGVLKVMKSSFGNIEPVLGRLLSKQRRDPRMLSILLNKQHVKEIRGHDKNTRILLLPKKVPNALLEHYRASVINAPIFQNYLLSQGIHRVEIDNLLWGVDLKIARDIKVSIYLPYGYITTTRTCGRVTLTNAACRKECKIYYLQLENRSLPTTFYSIGNTVFYKQAIPGDEYLRKLGITRIVYQPRLPF